MLIGGESTELPPIPRSESVIEDDIVETSDAGLVSEAVVYSI